MAQPTTRRECASRSTARQSQPSQVALYVMSPSHKRCGTGALNVRTVRLGAGA